MFHIYGGDRIVFDTGFGGVGGYKNVGALRRGIRLGGRGFDGCLGYGVGLAVLAHNHDGGIMEVAWTAYWVARKRA